MLGHWTSAHPILCALEFVAILACGIGGGLVTAYGPVHSLAWIFGVHRHDATFMDLLKRSAFLFLLMGLGISLFAAAWKPHLRLEVLLFDWLLVLLMLLAAGPKAYHTAGRRWGLACCDALAAVYGPFLVAGIHTRLFDGANTWLPRDFWKYLPMVPGGVIIELISASIWHRHPGLSPIVMFLACGLLSATVVAVTAWLAVRRRSRWLWIPLIGGLCAFGARILDAAMRA
jgi:hypothetical protein